MYNIDKVDAQIINLLVDNGRASCAEIARRIGDISERTVRYRMERMTEEDLLRGLEGMPPAESPGSQRNGY